MVSPDLSWVLKFNFLCVLGSKVTTRYPCPGQEFLLDIGFFRSLMGCKLVDLSGEKYSDALEMASSALLKWHHQFSLKAGLRPMEQGLDQCSSRECPVLMPR